jgi:hypothetical protein
MELPRTPRPEIAVPQRGCRRVGAAERAQKVGRQDRLPEILGHRVEVGEGNGLRPARRAGIVDQHVQTAQHGDGVADHRLGFAGPADIAGDAPGVDSQRAKLRDPRRRLRVVRQMIDGDPRAAFPEQPRRRQPDPGGAPGDQNPLPGKIRRYHRPLLLQERCAIIPRPSPWDGRGRTTSR